LVNIDKAHINPADAPESVKSELAKINKRQDDIIRFIRHYEGNSLKIYFGGSIPDIRREQGYAQSYKVWPAANL
jgi:hypothetical protein